MNETKILMTVALILAITAIVYALMKRDRSSTSHINLEDLLLGEDGKLSKAAAVMMGSFAFDDVADGVLSLGNKMTEGYLAIYVAAWIAPTVTRLIVGKPAETIATVETSTTSVSRSSTPGNEPPHGLYNHRCDHLRVWLWPRPPRQDGK
jgi:hypothetical protein